MIDTQANITANINVAQPRDFQRMWAFLESPQVRVAYLMNAGHDTIDHALKHCELVVVRIFNPFNEPDAHNRNVDGYIHHTRQPQAILDYLNRHFAKYKGIQKLRFIVGWNEPETNPNDPERDLKQLIQWMADVGDLLASNGYGAALGTFAVAKTIPLPLTNKEIWIPLYEVLAKHQAWLHVDIHEYEMGFAPINYLQTSTPFPQRFLDRAALANPARWGAVSYTGAGVQSNYKIGRFAEVMVDNLARGYPPMRVGRGECIHDHMIEDWWKDWFHVNVQAKFGHLKGILSLRPYCAWIQGYEGERYNQYTDGMFSAFIAQQLAWLKQNSGDGCLYNAIFAWNTNEFWQTEDISDPSLEPLVRWIMYEQSPYTPVPPPTPQPIPVPTPAPSPVPTWETLRIQGNGTRVNIRAEANINSMAIGVLAAAPIVTVVEVVTEILDPQGYQWRKVRFNGLEGWLAFKFVVAVPEVVDPRVPILVEALKAVRNGFVEDNEQNDVRISFLDEILAEIETPA